MSYAELKEESVHLFNEYPFLTFIRDEQDYKQALELIEELLEDDIKYEVLINLLTDTIEKWENQSELFSDFNQRQEEIDKGIATLKVIMDQHQLGTDDFHDEIGKKSYVSQILNGKRNLTLNHIRGLSRRFGIPGSLFV